GRATSSAGPARPGGSPAATSTSRCGRTGRRSTRWGCPAGCAATEPPAPGRPGAQLAEPPGGGSVRLGQREPVVPTVVEHQPGQQAVTGLARVHAVTGGDVGVPLVVGAQRGEGLDVPDLPPARHVGEG